MSTTKTQRSARQVDVFVIMSIFISWTECSQILTPSHSRTQTMHHRNVIRNMFRVITSTTRTQRSARQVDVFVIIMSDFISSWTDCSQIPIPSHSQTQTMHPRKVIRNMFQVITSMTRTQRSARQVDVFVISFFVSRTECSQTHTIT